MFNIGYIKIEQNIIKVHYRKNKVESRSRYYLSSKDIFKLLEVPYHLKVFQKEIVGPHRGLGYSNYEHTGYNYATNQEYKYKQWYMTVPRVYELLDRFPSSPMKTKLHQFLSNKKWYLDIMEFTS